LLYISHNVQPRAAFNDFAISCFEDKLNIDIRARRQGALLGIDVLDEKQTCVLIIVYDTDPAFLE
jgi:hypothetical protein